jgi:hypothetical protein
MMRDCQLTWVSPPPTCGGGAKSRGRVRRPEPRILSPSLWGAGDSPTVLQKWTPLGPQFWRHKGSAAAGNSGDWVSIAVRVRRQSSTPSS